MRNNVQKHNIILFTLTLIIMLLGLTSCGETPWDLSPNLSVSLDKETILIGETANIEISLDVWTELEKDTELSEKQQEQLDLEQQEYLEQIREEYTISYTIPEEYQEMIEWKEEGKTIAGLSSGEAEIHVVAEKTQPTEDDPEEPTSVIHITVKEISPTEIKVAKENLTMTEGDNTMIKPEVLPENAANQKVSFQSSDKKIATIGKDGKLTAMKAGTCTITITAQGDENVTTDIKVTVTEKQVAQSSATNRSNQSAQSSGNNSSGSNSSSKNNNSSSSSSEKSSGGSSGQKSSSNKQSSGSSKNSGKSSTNGTITQGGGEINGKNYSNKEDYDQGLKDLEQWEKDNGVIWD